MDTITVMIDAPIVQNLISERKQLGISAKLYYSACLAILWP